MQAPLPADEAARLRELQSYNILDTEHDANFDRIVRLARAATGMPVALISLVDSGRQWFKAHLGLAERETPREQAFCAHAILDREVLIVEDATKDDRFSDNPLVTQENGIRFYAGAPLVTRGGHALGTLCVIDQVPRTMAIETTKILADMAALVVDELELRRLSGLDGLTGVFNKRFSEELIRRECHRARRAATRLSIGVIDVDHFRAINTDFGHLAGDAALRALARTCSEAMRAHDVFGRFGGEEFVVVLPQTALAEAHVLLERLRAKIAALSIPDLNGRALTVSIGVAEFLPSDVDEKTVLARADAALYRAKSAGRNQVVMDRVA